MTAPTVTARIGKSRFQAEITAQGHVFVADEPAADGGKDEGPAPYDLLLSALGACTVMTLRSYADLKQLDVSAIEARLSLETKTEQGRQITLIHREIRIEGNIPPEMRQRMMTVADKCPVHKVLSGQIEIFSREGGGAGHEGQGVGDKGDGA
jgi:putative redox protein